MKRYLLTLAALALAFGCTRPGPKPKAAPFTPSDIKVEVKSGGPVILTTSAAEFQVQPSGYIQAFLLPGEHPLTLDEPRLGAPTDSNYVIRGDKELHFTLAFDQTSVLESVGQLGPGKRVEIPGHPLGPSGTTIDAVLTLEAYDAFPNLLLSTVAYKNTGSDSLAIDRAIEQEHRFNAHLADSLARPWDMWSFQGSRYDAPEDDVFRLTRTSASRSDEDTLVKSGFAGGIPVVAFWTGSVGEAIGHVETAAAPASLRFRIAPDERVIAQLNIPGHLLQPGETFSGPRSFLAVYSGDFYQSLRMWSGLLQKEGSTLAIPSPEAYSAGWSGYESSVAPGQMLGAIAGLKGLGIRRATLDGRWFEGFGDWNPRPDTYPGDAIKQLTAAFHKQSLFLDLAWLPLGVEDGQAQQGSHAIAGIVQQHPDWLVLDQDGQHARTKRGLALLCPAVPAVQAYYGQLVEKFIRDWDFDGLQLDAIARVPWCYNPAHHHSSPEDSVNAMVDVYKVICQTAHALKPLSVSQECPCGASPSLASLRFLDQIAAGETATAAQLRRRIKMYKALFGPAAPVYAAEGELSAFDPAGDPRRESGEDLAAIIGTGGVVGVGFDLLQPNAGSGGATARRNEVGAKKWIALYNHNMLSKGSFLDLYTYGYDVPEGYAIAKDGNMYYAFFAPKEDAPWRGQLQLRGLKPGRYQVTDYDRGRSYGTVESGIGKTPHLAVDFTGHLLLVARP